MAIFRVGYKLHEASGAETTVSEEITVGADVSLIVVEIGLLATIDVATIPAWSGVNFDLIDETTNSGSAGDMHVYSYGLVVPAIETGNITWTIDSSADSVGEVTMWSGTVETSVANATNALNEAVNDTASNTSAIASGGTAGRTLMVFGAMASNLGDPATIDVAFSKINTGDVGAISYFSAQKLGGAPDAATITWGNSTSEENAAHMIELIPKANFTTQAEVAALAVAYADGVASYKQGLT